MSWHEERGCRLQRYSPSSHYTKFLRCMNVATSPWGLNFSCPPLLSVRCSVCAFQTRQSYSKSNKQHPSKHNDQVHHPASTKYHQSINE
eukprot:scaffold12522_cov152-Skeletonema_dohrnii-CCMP3373.AAC.2